MTSETTKDEVLFFEDKRAAWRVCWILAYAFLLVCGLMLEQGAGLGVIPFLGIAVLMLGIGVSALLGRKTPLLAVVPQGLQVYAGAVGLGGTGSAGRYVIPWSALTSVEHELRKVRNRQRSDYMYLPVLSFGVVDAVARPDGHQGFLVELAGRRTTWALGEHMLWRPEIRKLDLSARPRGGWDALTTAIARVAPQLGGVPRERRPSLGGPVSYAILDTALAVGVLGTLVLLATDRMDLYARLAAHVLAWGGRVSLF